MPNITVYDITGKAVGEMALSDEIFGVSPNETAVQAAVKNHLANRRQGTQSTLTRAEVSGGGRKPWRQKGTGNARQGSTRAPHWTHGGIAFGPKPRDFSYRINKKLRRLALFSALSAKVAEGNLIVIDNLDFEAAKTKTFAGFLKAVGALKRALVVTPEVRENVVLSARNIPDIKTTIATVLSTYDIVNADKFIIDKKAIETIEEVYAQ